MSKPSGQPIRPAPRESSGGANMLDQSDHAPDDPGQRLKDRRGGMRAPPPLTGNEQKTWTGRPASKTYPLVLKCQSTGTTLFSHVLVEPGDEHFDSRLPVRCPREHELDGAHFYETRSRRARRSSDMGLLDGLLGGGIRRGYMSTETRVVRADPLKTDLRVVRADPLKTDLTTEGRPRRPA